MAAEIGRKLGEIQKEISQVGSKIKDAEKNVRELNNAMKLDNGNVKKARQMFEELRVSLKQNERQAELLRNKLQALESAKSAGTIAERRYEKEIKQTNKALEKTTANVKSLSLSLENQNSVIFQTQINNYTNKLNKLQGVAQKVSRTLLVMIGALGAAVASSVSTGDVLDDTSRKWQITAEKLQINNNLFDKITESSMGYEDALKSLGGVMSSIAKGRGAAYIRVLQKLGISQEELNDMNTAELYDRVYESLRNVTDETQRAVLAQQLMGETGLNVALVAGTSAEEIARLNDELEKNGIISSEEAASAGKISDTWADVKIQAREVFTQFREAIYPMLLVLFDFLKDTALPALKTLTSWFANMSPGMQRLIVILAIFLIFLPKIISFIKIGIGLFKMIKTMTLAQAGANAVLGVASMQLVPIFIAVAAIATALILLFSLFSQNAREAADSVSELTKQASAYEDVYAGINGDASFAAYTVAENKTVTTSNINLDVKTSGDTAIDKENAAIISDAVMADVVDRVLGRRV